MVAAAAVSPSVGVDATFERAASALTAVTEQLAAAPLPPPDPDGGTFRAVVSCPVLR